LPGVTERQDAWDDLPSRHPKWISLSNSWAWRYLEDPKAATLDGRTEPHARLVGVDAPSRRYFRALMAGELGYRVAHTSEWSSKLWPVVHIHESTGSSLWILERVD
jgi:hypothetical protein